MKFRTGSFRKPLGSLATIVACVWGMAAAAQQPAPRIEAPAGAFRITFPDGAVKQGAELAGAVLVFNIDGAPLRVRIASVTTDTRDPKVLLHDFRIAETDKPLCAPDPDGLQAGFPLSGRSTPDGGFVAAEPHVFELVCTSGAQGKCLRLGYHPWETAPGGPILDYFNACVRMARADYCGNGETWTRDGTLIDVWDLQAIQKSDRQDDKTFSFEAGWTPGGAVCVAHTRIPENISLEKLKQICPRLSGIPACTEASAKGAGALVFNRSR